ncbi:serine hydrolase domain-containing protein [Sandaracinobacteroides saxicola]|uniref:Serine hydrolase n=1 Tax=Sandaracinobacteroides saxicola TaxID=2759707 RepID=A0A7G5IHP1_9SPHN|nr:serine hydrolase [Sandaracinobacteroides saxicola]QMW22883.1 serine hydrolase [Sandaracinobacteroides saxicola]
MRILRLTLLVLLMIGYFANKTYMDRYLRMAVAQAMGKPQRADWYEPVDPVPGAAWAPLPVAATPAIDAGALSKASAYAKQSKADGFLVWHGPQQGGAIQTAGYWNGFRQTELLASKSMAKMVVGIVIGRAVSQGFIRSIDQPVSDFITEWKGTPKAAPTIRQFLQNSSGISRFSYNDFKPWSLTMREYLSEHHERILIDETTLDYPPGSEYDYSMITSDVLAIVIERATKQRYADYLGHALLKPIGAAGGTVYVNRPGGLAHTGCCLMLPAESFLRLGVLLMNRGLWNAEQILPPTWVAETVTPSPANPHWGLHMWIGKPCVKRLRWFPRRSQEVGVLHGECYAADDLFLFDGSGNQAMWIIPSRQLVVLRVGPPPTRRPGDPGEFDNSILPNLMIRGLRP